MANNLPQRPQAGSTVEPQALGVQPQAPGMEPQAGRFATAPWRMVREQNSQAWE